MAGPTAYGYTGRIPEIPKKSVHEILLRKCWDFWDSIFRSSTKSIFTGTVQHLLWLCWKCSENAGIRRRCPPNPWNPRINPYGCPPLGSNGRQLASLYYKKPTVRQNVSAAVGTLEKKRKLRRFILITAVNFIPKWRLPLKKNLGRDSWLVNPK